MPETAERPGVPPWLKIVYTLWIVVWVPVYVVDPGPANFLWLCDVANFVILVAVWSGSALLFSSQAVAVLLIQTVWSLDFASRLLFGSHLVGGTEYMFDPSTHLALRSLSLFHVAVPILLVWMVWRLGYDRRALKLQTAITCVLLPLSALPDPERNLNWLHAPFGVPQTFVPLWVFVLVCMAVYPLLIYLPTHLVLRWLAPASGTDVAAGNRG